MDKTLSLSDSFILAGIFFIFLLVLLFLQFYLRDRRKRLELEEQRTTQEQERADRELEFEERKLKMQNELEVTKYYAQRDRSDKMRTSSNAEFLNRVGQEVEARMSNINTGGYIILTLAG